MAFLPESRLWRTTIIVLASFIFLAVFFYAEEDLRGWLAWEHCKHTLEAKGEVLDWNAYIPPPVPDDQNFFKAPKMAEWFVRPKSGVVSNELTSKLTSLYYQHPYISSATIAEVTVLPASADATASQNTDIVLRYDPFSQAVFSEDSPAGSNVAVSNADANTFPVVILFQDIPITAAIENLARQAGIKYVLDPKIGYGQPDQNGQIKPEPRLSLRWANVTPREALLALLDNYELQLVENPQTGVALVTEKTSDIEVRIASSPLPDSTNDVTMPIRFEDVPITKAIDALARQAGINCEFDPKIGYGFPDQNGHIQPEPALSIRWDNITPRQALLAILQNYDLLLIYYPKPAIAVITKKDSRAPKTYVSPDVREWLNKLFADAVGPFAESAIGIGPILARPPGEIKPVRMVFHSDTTPGTNEMKDFFAGLFSNDNTGNAIINTHHIHIDSDGTNTFRVMLDSPSAADYLASEDPFEPDFDLIREALKRPYARMDGDYSYPTAIPFQNFVTIRMVVQALADRAECDLLLGQPDKALRELTLMHDMCRILEEPPSGKPMTLISAMINGSVSGLYVGTIADGMRLHAWQEPQLAALQKQLADINLTPFVFQAFHEEPASLCRMFEDLVEMDNQTFKEVFGLSQSWKWADLKTPMFWLIEVAPHGWIYQNMVNVAELDEKPLDGFDLTHDTIAPRKFDEASRAVDEFLKNVGRSTPYKYLAAIAIPNFSKSWQTTARNQTMANEAQIVCALERYHLAHGEYPETLDALTSQFIEKIPHDIIGGQPLHYRRTDDGKYLLYSVGWNETDDGGHDLSTQTKGGSMDYTKGDWVWKN
jgi:hypothetical protein